MTMGSFVLAFLSLGALFALGEGAHPIVRCPVPVSPLNGQTFLTKTGMAVKYTCNPGFKLQGVQIAICREDQWYPEPPTCEPISAEEEKPGVNVDEKEAVSTTPRPLFKWDDIDDKNEVNDTAQGDEARLHMVLYPRGRVVTTTRVTPVRVRSGARLEEEEKKRSDNEKSTAAVTAPSVVYVRRPVASDKTWPYYYRAPLHVVVNNADGSVRTDEDVRRYYYWANQYPRSAVMEYRTGQPLGITLSESQLAWINSMHPEVRDRYLKDLYDMKAKERDYLTYTDGYHWVSGEPYFTRQPMSVVDDPVAPFDYSCHRAERDGTTVRIDAPNLRNAYVHAYHKKYNPNYPHNVYLSAEYKCKPGYVLLDHRFTELYCSRDTWIGNPPVCVRKI